MKNIFEKFIFPEKEEKAQLPQRSDQAVADQKIDRLLMYNSDLIESVHSLVEERKKLAIKSLARLVLELQEQIPHYDTILSDDASARLASLFLKEVINKKKAELGQKSVQIFFVASGRHGGEETNTIVDRFIAEKKISLGKTLLVSEYIETGKSINILVKILEKYGIDFDIASVSVDGEFIDKINHSRETKDHFSSLIKRLRYGTKGRAGLAFFHQPRTTGVRKDPMAAKSAHPQSFFKHEVLLGRGAVGEARREMKLLAAEISKLI